VEHIRHTIVGPAGQAAIPLQVVGAVNEVLQADEHFRDEVTAVAWQPPAVILRSSSSAAGAILRQQEAGLLQQANEILRRRYGGPVVERLVVRLTTGQ
jgi:hypothetical protein